MNPTFIALKNDDRTILANSAKKKKYRLQL